MTEQGLAEGLMSKDHLHLAKLRDYHASHGVLPPYSGIAKMVGMKSKGAAYAMVGRLAEQGYLAKMPDRRIEPKARFFERELADSVTAGIPQPANELTAEILNIDAYLIDKPSQTVLLSIKGDSMIEAGLMPNDNIVVKKGAPAKIGDIVVAFVDGECTVKYLDMERGKYFLRPGNKSYPNIYPREDLSIFGLVVGSFRRYGHQGATW